MPFFREKTKGLVSGLSGKPCEDLLWEGLGYRRNYRKGKDWRGLNVIRSNRSETANLSVVVEHLTFWGGEQGGRVPRGGGGQGSPGS